MIPDDDTLRLLIAHGSAPRAVAHAPTHAEGGIGNGGFCGCGGGGADAAHDGHRSRRGARGPRGATLDAASVRRVVQRNLGQVRHCYEQALSQVPNAEGRVSVRWVIGSGSSRR